MPIPSAGTGSSAASNTLGPTPVSDDMNEIARLLGEDSP
jgi:hypothetical protein